MGVQPQTDDRVDPSIDRASTGGLISAADGSGAMFDRIAPRYDLLNRVLSLGIDRRWRRLLVAAATVKGASRLLDVATGTADVAIALCRAMPDVLVVGLDPSEAMLEVGRRKCRRAGLADRVELVTGDGSALPFDDDSYAACTIAFGIRNVPNRLACLGEMRRVVRPGGVVAVLELAEPDGGLIGGLARWHVHTVVPRVGAWLSGAAEYRYLQTSVAAFPPPAEFAALMERAGCCDLTIHRLTFGAAHLYVGRVPAATAPPTTPAALVPIRPAR